MFWCVCGTFIAYPFRWNTFSTAIVEDGAHLDASTDEFWGGHNQRAYFNVKVFNLTTPLYRTTSVPSLYRRFEKEKRRKYEQRVKEVELSSFVPLEEWVGALILSGLFTIHEEGHSLLHCCSLVTVFLELFTIYYVLQLTVWGEHAP